MRRSFLLRPVSVALGRRGLLALTTAACALLAVPAVAEPADAGCALVAGELPAGCDAPNAGSVTDLALQPNVEPAAAPAPLGDLGFSISIDSVTVAGVPAPEPVQIAGAPAALDTTRHMDRLFDAAGIELRYDGLGARPILNVSTTDLARTFVAGQTVTFRSSSNYPAWIHRAEIRLIDRAHPGRAVQILPVASNGEVSWTPAPQGPDELAYVLRVYDREGRFDETAPLPLDRTGGSLTPAELTGPIIAAGEGEDRTARRGIPVRGGAVTLSGQDVPPGATIAVMGEAVRVDASGAFVLQRILPLGEHGIRVAVAQPGAADQAIERPVDIPRAEWFATGMVDLTIGRDLGDGDISRTGRVAAFADGILADGTRITASIDTGEDDLEDLFGNLGRKDPDEILRGIDPADVFAVTGDDSVTEDLAPTHDGLYLRVERDGSHVMYGDFQPAEDPSLSVRSDRALTGLEGTYRSLAVTEEGEARRRVTAFAAEPDTLAQRDVLRATGGSAYVLSRQDLERGSETLLVEVRDPVSGRLVGTRRLQEGSDYRIDTIQGIVYLDEPLSPSSGAGGLVSDSPLGDLDVNLVAQYEYTPTTGSVDGLVAGGRAETWLTDSLRVGASALSDDTGVAESRLFGVDLLLRRSEGTWASLDLARSEGPGFGSTLSLDGGLTNEELGTAGLTGRSADSLRLEGRADLADLGWRDGFVGGYYDRKDAGFSSPDQEIEVDQTAIGVDGQVGLTDTLDLTFGLHDIEAADGETRRDGRIGIELAFSPSLVLETEIAHTDRVQPSGDADDSGRRTDAGARLTFAASEDASYWVFGQATLDRDGLEANNRLGVGMARRLTETLSFEGEVSGGNLGPAAEAGLTYAPNAGTTYSLGYRLDPSRADDHATRTGPDRGSLVLGAERQWNEHWSAQTETTWSGLGDEPSLASTYGVSYTPNDAWIFEGGLIEGRTTEEGGGEIRRTGLSFGVKHTAGEDLRSGLGAEVRRETADEASSADDRTTWLLSGFTERRTSEDWRLLGNLDLLYSDSDEGSFRDGRYAEAQLGYAYRPADNDRMNALLSYTYLYDMPGPDQVNVDGETEGDRQRSHILNAAMTYDLDPRWTLGLKYGLRHREQAPREGGEFTSSIAHLAIARIDYHVVQNWDILAEGRAMYLPRDDATEFGAMAGVYRHVGRNLRVGVGYEWGGVSDDLRSISDDREEIFLNVIASF